MTARAPATRCRGPPLPPPPPTDRRTHPAAALLAALALVAPPSPPAAAATSTPPPVQHNVRVQDVDDAILRAGLEAANAGDLAAAERDFAAVVSRDGPSPSILSNLAQTRLSLGRPAAALRDADAALALAPDAPAIHVVRALAHEALAVDAAARGDDAAARGHLAAGVADCDAALAVDPTDFTALFDRGGLQQRLARYDDAAASFAAAADAAPGLSGYRARHAELLFQTGDAVGAARELRGVVRRAPTFAEARAALAAVAWAAGDVATAEAQLAAAQTIDDAWGTRGAAEGTRWPPALVEAYQRLVDIK